MASSVEICNRALQKLGANRITSLDQDSKNARACNAAYDALRLAELEAHDWSCAITRASLAADSEEPIFGRAGSFTLPADFVSLLDDYPEANFLDKDWIVEGRKIYTNDSAPLELRYIFDLTDAAVMNPLFREALACRIALELCEEITQSNTKKAAIKDDYKDTIRLARNRNAIKKRPAVAPDGSWLTGRN